MSVLVKGYTKKDFDKLVKYARYGANNCMIGEGAEVVEIPPHGDLIDRDALEQDAQKRLLVCQANNNQFQKPYEVMRAIALAPTIIEADYPPSTPLEQVWTELFGEDGEA